MWSSHRETKVQIDPLLQASESLMLSKLCRPNQDRLNALIRYHLASGGSRTRAQLALRAGIALDLDHEICVALATSCELIHNASLLHDDIQDGDTHRRGCEAAWSRFDSNTAMCAGTLMLSTAFETLSQLKVDLPKLLSHLHHRTADLIGGQTLDLAGTKLVVDVQAYVKIAVWKSGSLLALPLELVMIAAQQMDAISVAKVAGESFALAYQIADDLKDIDEDIARDRCNIVRVLQSAGLSTEQAMTEAITLAHLHLQWAKRHADQLPNGSGDFLNYLCHQLENTISAEDRLRCSQV